VVDLVFSKILLLLFVIELYINQSSTDYISAQSKDIVIECKRYFGFRDVDELITQRKRAFLAAFNANMYM